MADNPHPNCVPNADTATAHEDKFLKYLLNGEHDEGKSKAKLFGRLGFTTENWRVLQDQLLAQLPLVAAVPREGENGAGGRNTRLQCSLRVLSEQHP